MIRFWVAGEPQGEPRPRVATRGGKPRTYSPSCEWRRLVRRAAQALEEPLLDGPVAVRAGCYFTRPKRLQRKADPDGPILHTSKPDADNVAKATLDGLSGVLFDDDRQVAELMVVKYYCPKTGQPGVDGPGAVIEAWSMDHG